MGFDSKQTAVAHTGPAPTERMMQAIVQDSYGSADELRSAQIERPEIADNEVIVRVHAAGLDRGNVAPDDRYAVSDADHGVRVPRAEEPGARHRCRRDRRGGGFGGDQVRRG